MSDKLLANLFRNGRIVQSPIYVVLPQYVAYLRSRSYADDTIQRYVASLVHFAYRLNKRTALANIDDILAAKFVEVHLPSCDCPRPCMRHVGTVRAALKHFLSVLDQHGMSGTRCPKVPAPIDIELELFRGYLIRLCGYAQTTCNNRIWDIRRFLDSVFGSGPVMVAQLAPNDIENFIARSTKGLSHATRRSHCVHLASYLRFRTLQGDDTRRLFDAIPLLAPPMPARLPTALTDKELNLFLTAFDLTVPIGMRNYAIVQCMTDLALRRMEVIRLQLDWLDWRQGTVTLKNNKSGRERKLPLPVRTGEAIVRYLRDGRPRTGNRAVFVRHIAPYDKPLGAYAINDFVRRAFIGVGLGERFRGVHVLRRTAATRLAQCGVSLKEIADVLGHKRLNTTTLYTRLIWRDCMRSLNHGRGACHERPGVMERPSGTLSRLPTRRWIQRNGRLFQTTAIWPIRRSTGSTSVTPDR